MRAGKGGSPKILIFLLPRSPGPSYDTADFVKHHFSNDIKNVDKRFALPISPLWWKVFHSVFETKTFMTVLWMVCILCYILYGIYGTTYSMMIMYAYFELLEQFKEFIRLVIGDQSAFCSAYCKFNLIHMHFNRSNNQIQTKSTNF